MIADKFTGSQTERAWLWYSDMTPRVQINVEYWLMQNPPSEHVAPLVYAKAKMTDNDLYRGCSQ